MGLRLEGVSRHGNGNWTLNILHNSEWIKATFEVIVDGEPTTTDSMTTTTSDTSTASSKMETMPQVLMILYVMFI
jgi:hypothetical protein